MPAVDLHQAALLKRASECFKNRRFSQAKQICDDILASNKRSVAALELLGEIMIQWQKHLEAVPYLERAVALEPKSTRFRSLLGRAHLATGNYTQALSHLERVLRVEPNNVYCKVLMADTFRKRGDVVKARTLLGPFIREGTD